VTSTFLGSGVKANLSKTLRDKDDSDLTLADHLSYENAEAFFKLIPQNSSTFSKTLRMFAHVQIEEDPEEILRLNEFLDWFACGSYNFKFYIGPFEPLLASLVPSKVSVDEVLRAIQRSRSALEDIFESDNPLIEAYSISSSALRCVMNVDEEVTQWSIYGVSDNAAGAKYWMHCWTSLQCSPIWGSLPLAGTDKFHTRVNPFIAAPTDATIGRIYWRLGYLVGPECMRRRIECDFVSFAEDDDKLERQAQNSSQIEISTLQSGDSSIDVDMVLRNLNRVSYKSLSRAERLSAAVDSEEFFNSAEIEKSIANVGEVSSLEDHVTEQDADSRNLTSSAKFGLDENEEEIGSLRSFYRPKSGFKTPSDRSTSDISTFSASSTPDAAVVSRRSGGRFSTDILATAIATTISDGNLEVMKPTKLVKLSSRSSADDARSSVASRQSIISPPILTASSETLAALDPSANESLLQLATTPKHEMNEASRKNLLLNEILAGLIGVQEWVSGTIMNVQR
jgi:hypothetical protein